MGNLEIRYQLVKEDGSFGDHEKPETDWTECWFVNYDGFCMIVDSANRIVELGAVDIGPSDLMRNWMLLEEMDVELKNYPVFLNKLVDFIGNIDKGKPFVHPSVKTLTLLEQHGFIPIEDVEEVGRILVCPLEYIDSMIESLVDTARKDIKYHITFMDYSQIAKLLGAAHQIAKGQF